MDAIVDHGEAELMSEYFEPVSVLSLGSVLGLGELDGDTLRRWFYGLAQGAIEFEDDPARGPSPTRPGRHRPRARTHPRAAVGGTRCEHDRDDAAARRGIVRRARGRGAADAEGDPARRHAGAGSRCTARPSPGCSSRGKPSRSPQTRPVSCGTRSRKGCAGSRRSARRPAERRRDGARRSGAARRRESRRARLVGQPRRGGLRADRRRVRPLPHRGVITPRSGSGLTSAPATTSRGVQMRIAMQRLFERLPSLRADDRRRVHRLGVPGAAAPSRAMGCLMIDLALPISPTALATRRLPGPPGGPSDRDVRRPHRVPLSDSR